MANFKKPTYAQKKRITKAKLNWEAYLVKKETPEGLIVVNKETKEEKIIK